MSNTEKQSIRLLIVEDYSLFRVGLVSLLKAEQDITVVGEAENAEEGIALVNDLRPDVVLMDLGLPKMNGIEATKKVKEIDKGIKVVILTSHESEESVLAALSAGANAYCMKDIPSTRLTEVVKSVYEGAAWLDPTIAEVALKLFNTPGIHTARSGSSLVAPLGEREMEVLRHIVKGKNNNEIAEELFVSVHTVKAHVSNILQKLAVDDRVQAAVKAVQEGLV